MELCRQAITRGGLYPAAVNAANEEAVSLFLNRAIGFGDISRLAARPMEWELSADDGIEAVLEADRMTRIRIREAARSNKK